MTKAEKNKGFNLAAKFLTERGGVLFLIQGCGYPNAKNTKKRKIK